MRHRITNKRPIILLLFGLLSMTILVISFIFSNNANNRIRPEAGVLNLDNWNPKDDGILSLSGYWNFYWEDFILYEELIDTNVIHDVSAEVPGVWNNYRIDGENLPGYGYGTYILKIENAPVGEIMALRIPTFSTAYELYINDSLVSSNGLVGKSKEQSRPGYMPRVVEFTTESESLYLIFHVSNFTYARGGMWYAIPMGSREQILSMDQVIADKDLFLFGALTVMAIYYLIIFLLRREDKSSLYFVFMCILFASRVAIYGDYLIYRLIPFISFRAIIFISYSTLCWFSICSAYMVGELFPKENSKKILRAGFIYALIMTLLFSLSPISFFTQIVNIVQVVAILFGAYSVYTLCKSYIKGKRGSGIVLLGALVVIVCAAHDVLYNNNVILSNTGELVPTSLFILLILQSFILSRRSSEAFEDVHTLSNKLLKLDKIKDEFLANTSHELRTPLSGILGLTEAMLKGSDGEMSDKQKEKLTMIAGSSRRLSNLVNDILDYSRMKNGDIKLDIKPIHIGGLIQNVVNVFHQLNASKEFDFIVEIPKKLPIVLADESRVMQILYNLVGNASKFTASGYIRVSAGKVGDMLEICVRDTGEGIPEDKLEDIFKSFEQVDNSITRKYGGTGLGLPITKQLVKLQGGNIWVKSILGTGSEFYFTLPVAYTSSIGSKRDGSIPEELPSENAITISDKTESDSTKRGIRETGILGSNELSTSNDIVEGGIRVLLVDDDSINLQAASSVLRLEGYVVTAVNSGRAALRELEREIDYSLVILDVMMPELSGYEVCIKLRESKTSFELPVLMLTAKTSTDDVVMGFEAGANDYLSKPFEAEELLARVRTLVDLKISVDKAKVAEIAFMQAQIKPHFLFNTLNVISSFCDTDPTYAQKIIDDFSNYLRHSFDFKNLQMFVTLEKELSLANSYTEIEKARFGDKLKVDYDIDKNINIPVPLLSIQPLIENSISHGIRKRGGGGTVKVSVKEAPEGVEVAVIDDGQGISPERLSVLLMPESGRGIGLWNIDRRLKRHYGKGLTIESELGRGTKVSYIVPWEVGKDAKDNNC